MSDTPLRFCNFADEHLPLVLFIENESYPEPWTHGMFRQEITNAHSHVFVAFHGDRLVGYAGFWLVLDEAHVTRVTVAPDCRGLGYGRAIMEHLLAMAFSLDAVLVRLEVRENNEVARTLYDHLGFVVEGKRLNYYQRTNENAVLMVKRF